MQIEAIKSKDMPHHIGLSQGDTILMKADFKHGQYQSTNWDFVHKR